VIGENYSIDFKPYNETAMAMFHSSDGDHDGTFTRTELDQVFVLYDSDDLYTILSILLLSAVYCNISALWVIDLSNFN
jgi:hypothetical protein